MTVDNNGQAHKVYKECGYKNHAFLVKCENKGCSFVIDQKEYQHQKDIADKVLAEASKKKARKMKAETKKKMTQSYQQASIRSQAKGNGGGKGQRTVRKDQAKPTRPPQSVKKAKEKARLEKAEQDKIRLQKAKQRAPSNPTDTWKKGAESDNGEEKQEEIAMMPPSKGSRTPANEAKIEETDDEQENEMENGNEYDDEKEEKIQVAPPSDSEQESEKEEDQTPTPPPLDVVRTIQETLRKEAEGTRNKIEKTAAGIEGKIKKCWEMEKTMKKMKRGQQEMKDRVEQKLENLERLLGKERRARKEMAVQLDAIQLMVMKIKSAMMSDEEEDTESED